jgi:F-type H+-transporting ATPase subunit gamma
VATLRDIRRRIGSVQNTRKITKAMEMVAAAKLRRNQQRIESLRPYAIAMVEMMRNLAVYGEEAPEFPLLQQHDEERTVALLVMTGDRGLAGAFNANVLRKALQDRRELVEQGRDVRVLAVGKRGIGSLRFRGVELDRTWEGLSDRPVYSDAQQMARHVIERYVAGELDRVRVIYNQFTSPMEQKLMDVSVLPIPREEVVEEDREEAPVSFLYEPDTASILRGLLPAYVEIAIYRALLESSASEQGARMTAMRNASESAEEMMDSLTLALNRARQAAITQEILEVVAGADALS